MSRYTKLDPAGQPMAGDATDHVAVLDATTGLIWAVKVLPEMTWQQAIDACAALDLLEQKDWRLPTRAELQGLVDYDRSAPAIDVDAFPETPADAFWSSSPVAGWPGYAWGVDFGYGSVDGWSRDSELFVRPVRGPVAAPGQ